jgi:agmatinase
MNRNVQTFLGCDAEYADADIVLFGAPFDGTTSFRPGARFGPQAIRGESFGIETYSPYCERDLTELSVCDIGDLELPFGNPTKVLNRIRQTTTQIYGDGKRPFMLGGEHLVTFGALQAACEVYPELTVLHLDAHADLRNDYLGETLSHACVLRRAWELLGDERIHQFGIRSGEREEFAFAQAHTHMHRFDFSGWEETLAALRGKPVYLTLDLDVLDPSVFCGTGTPEAGGVSFSQLLEKLLLLNQVRLVGCDIVELSPHYDPSCVSTAVACKLVREILLQMEGA